MKIKISGRCGSKVKNDHVYLWKFDLYEEDIVISVYTRDLSYYVGPHLKVGKRVLMRY